MSVETQGNMFRLSYVALFVLSLSFFVSVTYLIYTQILGILDTRARSKFGQINSPTMTKRLVDQVAANQSMMSFSSAALWDELLDATPASSRRGSSAQRRTVEDNDYA